MEIDPAEQSTSWRANAQQPPLPSLRSCSDRSRRLAGSARIAGGSLAVVGPYSRGRASMARGEDHRPGTASGRGHPLHSSLAASLDLVLLAAGGRPGVLEWEVLLPQSSRLFILDAEDQDLLARARR